MKNIAVIFGGRSVEHEVSIISANQIMKWLRSAGYEVTPIYINKKSKWIVDQELESLEFYKDSRNLESKIDSLKIVDSSIILKEGVFSKTTPKIDVIFPVMHGTNGEDGTIQAFAELLNIPYVGCDKKSSTICMDKSLTNILVGKYDVPKVKWFSYDLRNFESEKEKIIEDIKRNFYENIGDDDLPYPLIVKPNNLGSSIGVSKVKNIADLRNALEVVSYLDNSCIVEKCVENLLEINCAIIGNDNPIPSLLESPKRSNDLLDFNDKYISGSMKGNSNKVEIPSPLDEQATKELQDMSVKVYEVLGCSGISRIDMLYDTKEKKGYFNEVNPMPGSLQAHLWRASGITSVELVKKLVQFAEERFEESKKFNTDYDSNILDFAVKGMGGKKLMDL